MRKIKKYFSFLLLALLIMISGNMKVVKAETIGNTMNNPVEVTLGEQYSKTWTKYTDDLFHYNKLTVNSTGILKMSFSKPIDSHGEYARLEVTISNADGEGIWDADGYYTKDSASNYYTYYIGLKPGTYYVNIKPLFWVISGNINVNYSFSFEKSSYAEVEPNEDMGTATLLTLNHMYKAYFGSDGGDYENNDYYKVYLTKGKEYSLKIGNYGKLDGTTTILDIYNPKGKEINTYNAFKYVDGNGNQYMKFTADVTGYYYVKIYNYHKAQIPYQIGVYTKQVSIKKAKVSGISTKNYTGKAIKQKVVVKLSGKTLKEGKDYKLVYSKNTNLGTATVKIVGINNYTGTISKTFKIVLAKVKGLKSSSSNNSSVTLKWNKNNLASGYQIYYSTSKNGTYKKAATINNKNTVSYKVNKLKAGTSYYFKIRAFVNVKGKKVYSDYSSAINAITKPSAAKITKISNGTTTATVTWKKVNNATGYMVYYSTSKNGTYKKVATINNKNTFSYKVNKLKSGTSYYFKIKTIAKVNGKKVYSSYSSPINVITKPSTTTIKNIKSTKNKATLTWNKVSNATGYKVYYSTSKNGKYTFLSTLKANNKITYTATNLKSGKTYYFKVRTYKKINDQSINGSYSNVKKIKVK